MRFFPRYQGNWLPKRFADGTVTCRLVLRVRLPTIRDFPKHVPTSRENLSVIGHSPPMFAEFQFIFVKIMISRLNSSFDVSPT